MVNTLGPTIVFYDGIFTFFTMQAVETLRLIFPLYPLSFLPSASLERDNDLTQHLGAQDPQHIIDFN